MSRDANDLGHILVVDDEEPVRDVLCEYLESQGFGVEAAPDGETALAALGRHRPDLVLLDVRMPGMDGVEVLRRIRHAAPHVPVVMVTANESVGLAREMLELGAFDYVAKPFDFSYLDRAVSARAPARAADPAGIRRALLRRRPRRGWRWCSRCSAPFAAWRRWPAPRPEPAWRTRPWRWRGWAASDSASEAASAPRRAGPDRGHRRRAGRRLDGSPDLAAVESALASARRALSPAG